MRVLVLGSTGLLGQMVLRHLAKEPSFRTEGTGRTASTGRLVFETEGGRAGLRDLLRPPGRYSHVINCIGVVKAKIDPADPASVRRAVAVNALFPHELAAAAGEAGASVIHVSTDGVFSENAGACDEDSAPDCIDLYGRTKLLGEVRAPNFLTLRCSIVGPDPVRRSGLLEWFLGHPEGAELEGYEDHMWNGVTTLQLAELCRRIIIRDCFEGLRRDSPLYHFCPNPPLSKYELLLAFRSAFGKRVVIRPSSSGGAAVKRVLMTRYEGIRELFGGEGSLAHALRDLAALA